MRLLAIPEDEGKIEIKHKRKLTIVNLFNKERLKKDLKIRSWKEEKKNIIKEPVLKKIKKRTNNNNNDLQSWTTKKEQIK